jgi:hypothetical protein
MKIKLPIPIFTKSNIYTDIEIMKPKASVIADCFKMIKSGKVYLAIRSFITGSTISLFKEDETEENNKINIKDLISLMPFRSAEYISMQIMILFNEDNDAIEGIYSCPRCEYEIINELSIDGSDSRDYVSECDVIYMEELRNSFTVNILDPVIIKNKNTDEILDTIESIELEYPTLSNCIEAEKNFRGDDEIRSQFAIYVESLLKVNGKEIDKKYKNMYGMFIFNNIKEVYVDLGNINNEIEKYGIDTTKEKECIRCGKIWRAQLNKSSFFGSGLAV